MMHVDETVRLHWAGCMSMRLTVCLHGAWCSWMGLSSFTALDVPPALRMRRTVFAVVASLMVCAAALATAASGLRLLLPCAMFGGFVFGWHWSLMPVLPRLFSPHSIKPLPPLCMVAAGVSTVSDPHAVQAAWEPAAMLRPVVRMTLCRC